MERIFEKKSWGPVGAGKIFVYEVEKLIRFCFVANIFSITVIIFTSPGYREKSRTPGFRITHYNHALFLNSSTNLRGEEILVFSDEGQKN